MTYEVIITSCRDRVDLLDRTLCSLLAQVDTPPERVIVHEDTRRDVPCQVLQPTYAILETIERAYGVPITLLERNPGGGLARGLLRALQASTAEFILYSQEDFDHIRALPIARCLAIMDAHGLHHVRFNKRKTMRCKHEDKPEAQRWYKREVTIGGQVFCVSDHWYFQTNLGRRSLLQEGFEELAAAERHGKVIDRCEMKFNRWFNTCYGGNIHLSDPAERREKVRTFIWGGIGEPAFIRHTGSDRRTQGWEE